MITKMENSAEMLLPAKLDYIEPKSTQMVPNSSTVHGDKTEYNIIKERAPKTVMMLFNDYEAVKSILKRHNTMLETLTTNIVKSTSDMKFSDSLLNVSNNCKYTNSKININDSQSDIMTDNEIKKLEQEKLSLQETVKNLYRVLYKQQEKLHELRNENAKLVSTNDAAFADVVDGNSTVVSSIKNSPLKRITIMIGMYKELFHVYDLKMLKMRTHNTDYDYNSSLKEFDELKRQMTLWYSNKLFQNPLLTNTNEPSSSTLQLPCHEAVLIKGNELFEVNVQNTTKLQKCTSEVNKTPSVIICPSDSFINKNDNDMQIFLDDEKYVRNRIKTQNETNIFYLEVNNDRKLTSIGIGEGIVSVQTLQSQTDNHMPSIAIETDSPILRNIGVLTEKIAKLENSEVQTTNIKQIPKCADIRLSMKKPLVNNFVNNSINNNKTMVKRIQSKKLSLDTDKKPTTPMKSIKNVQYESNNKHVKIVKKKPSTIKSNIMSERHISLLQSYLSMDSYLTEWMKSSEFLKPKSQIQKSKFYKNKTTEKLTSYTNASNSTVTTVSKRKTSRVSKQEFTIPDMSLMYNINLKNDNSTDGWTTYTTANPKDPVIVIGDATSSAMPCPLHKSENKSICLGVHKPNKLLSLRDQILHKRQSSELYNWKLSYIPNTVQT